jgi:hypothetical protein
MKNKIYTVALKGVLVMAISMAGIMVTFGQAPGWQWAKRAGGSGFEFGRRICTDPSGNIIVTGGFQSQSITFGPFTLLNTGGEDIFIVKYDVNGNVLWVKNPNGISYDFATDICTDYSGNIFITGNFQSDSLTFDTITLPNMYANASMFTAKYDPSGNIIWAKKTGNVWTPPGNGEYAAADVNGNCYVTGCMVDTMTFAGTTMTGYLDVFLVKYDSLGNELWAKSAMGNNFDIVNGISLDASGNLLTVHHLHSELLF